MRNRITALVVAALMAGAASGATSQVPAAKAYAAGTAKVPVVRTAKSLECSRQADARGLHGKPRKNFMSSCKDT